MALLLTIDTATAYGAVALSENESMIAALENNDQKEHASFLHPAIKSVLEKSNKSFDELDAVAVTIGPGSYTGLRVGLAAAKGLCYILKKPLIAVSTLQAMALAATRHAPVGSSRPVLFAPMIDARRMEVYTALYTSGNREYQPPRAVIIDEEIFASERQDHTIFFSGDGSKKLKNILTDGAPLMNDINHTIEDVAFIANTHYQKNLFEDIAYCEPFYLKPFYSANFVKS